MLIEHIFLGFCGLAAGLAVSAGTFAFLIVIGVIPRMIGKCNRAAETLHFENAVILGGICGNLASVFLQIRIPFGPALLCVYGISAGIFVGSIAVALAEILNTFLQKLSYSFCEYISDYIPAHGLKGRTLLGHACDGGRKSGRIAVLFPWKF